MSTLYAIRCGKSGPIKIGLSICVQERLRELQTAHHEPLEVIATAEGCGDFEDLAHETFAKHRLNGEWFEIDEQACLLFFSELPQQQAGSVKPKKKRLVGFRYDKEEMVSFKAVAKSEGFGDVSSWLLWHLRKVIREADERKT